jgi:anti-sigma B factor antagonist
MNDPHRLHETEIHGRGVDPVGSFSVGVEAAADGVRVIVLRGELDMAATEAVREAVDGAAGARGVVLDLSEVTFVDSSMLKELLRAGAELSRYETRLVLAGVPAPVRRLLDLTRTAQLFTETAGRAEALELLGDDR